MRHVSFARYTMLAAVLACTTTPKAPPVTTTPVRQQQNGAPQNLRVLPRTLSRDSVVHIMRFEVASGLACSASTVTSDAATR